MGDYLQRGGRKIRAGTVKDPYMCGKRLASDALISGSRDNVTVIVIFLKPVDTLERIYIESKEAAKGSMPGRVKLPQISLDEMHETLDYFLSSLPNPSIQTEFSQEFNLQYYQ